MNKTTIAAISAALLLCAVLCTAGCVEAPSDPIAGTYVTETDSAVSYAFFENDGTGLFTESAETADAAGVLQGTFDWTAVEPKKTYTLLFADGETETATLDAGRGLLTIGGVEYQKYPSELSGLAPKLEPVSKPAHELKKQQSGMKINTEKPEAPGLAIS